MCDVLCQSHRAEAEKRAKGNVYLKDALEIERPKVAPKFFIPLSSWQMDEPFSGKEA